MGKTGDLSLLRLEVIVGAVGAFCFKNNRNCKDTKCLNSYSWSNQEDT